MFSELWRLKVFDPEGLPRFVQDMGELKLDGSPSFEEEGNGNCREATFRGMVGINPRDWVDIQYTLDGSTWITRFSGVATQVRTGYNPDAGGYKLVGGIKKLEEAEAREVIQPGNLKDQIQRLWTSALTSGQLGKQVFQPTIQTDLGSIDYTLASVGSGVGNGSTPGTVIQGKGIAPNYQSVATVLKTVIAPRYPGCQVAVTADRALKVWKPTGTLVLDEINPDVHVEWTDVDAEELVTHVRFIFPRAVGGTVTYGKLERGAPITTARPGQAATVLVPVSSTPSTYGQSIKPLALSSSESQHFTRLSGSGDVIVSPLAQSGTGTPTYTGDDAALWDGDTGTSVIVGFTGPGISQISVSIPFSTALPVLGVEFVSENTTCRRCRITSPSGYVDLTTPSGTGGFWLLSDEAQAFLAQRTDTNLNLYFVLDIAGTANVTLRAATLLTPNADELGGVAQAAARLPAVQAGTVRMPGWPAPQPFVSIQRRDKDFQPIGLPAVIPAAIYKRSVTPAGELQTEISMGQRDTPEVSAAAALIKARDAQAALIAVRASV